MPGMLGWFSMKNHTSIEDIEWMLARSAAFNAGYAFVTSVETIEENGHSDQILERIKIWEEARMADMFSDDQKTRMEDLANEFRLTKKNNAWNLNQVYSSKFNHENKVRQPGEPLYSTFKFDNVLQKKTMHLIISASGADLSEIRFELDNYKDIAVPVHLSNGETFKYEGGSTGTIYNKTWQQIRLVEVSEKDFLIPNGEHQVVFDCKFISSGEEAKAKIEIRIIGGNEEIGQ